MQKQKEKKKNSGYILKEKLIQYERLKVITEGDLGELVIDLKPKKKYEPEMCN